MIHFKWLLFYVEYIMRWKWNSTLISSVKCPKNQTQKLPYSIKCSTEGQVLPKAISQFNQINKQASVMDTNANWSLQPLWDYCSFLYSYIYDVFANAISSSNNRKSHLIYLLFFFRAFVQCDLDLFVLFKVILYCTFFFNAKTSLTIQIVKFWVHVVHIHSDNSITCCLSAWLLYYLNGAELTLGIIIWWIGMYQLKLRRLKSCLIH